MKIFCIGRNYKAHIEELANHSSGKPLVFMKPSTALLREGKPFYYPNFSKNIHYECELVLRVAKHGKSIDSKFASTYIDAYTLGIDFTARDIQDECKENRHPWEIAKAFDASACIGSWIATRGEEDWSNIQFEFHKNGHLVQSGDSSLMLFPISEIIVYLSRFFTLQKGDLIYTGSPAGVGPVHIGDDFVGTIAGQEVLHCQIK